MPGTTYPGTSSRALTDYLGERLSVLSYGAKGDGSTDDGPAINAAITKLTTIGGRDLYLPGGRIYCIKTPIVIPSGTSLMRISGDGDGSLIQSGAVMPAGQGLFDIQGASRVRFLNFKVDAAVTTSSRILYSSLGSNPDPMSAALTTNTSFWSHSGSSYIRLQGVTISHTGGYSILVDATTGNIDDFRVIDCLFENNRPHLFGLASGDITGNDSGGRPNGYGSWSGGIHAQGDGNNYAVRNMLVQGCTFRRVTGNCVWTHVYALNKLHSNIRIIDNHFEDTGLDGIGMNGVMGGIVSDNTLRRVGYCTFDDTSASQPRYLTGKNATAIDTAGRTRGVNYVNNYMMSVNGGCIDLDGYSQGDVTDNTGIIPKSTDPEYTEDLISQIGPNNNGTNECYGVNTANSNTDSIAGTDINIEDNTFINMNAGAIRLFAARNCSCIGNTIDHPATSAIGPITYGPLGSSQYLRTTNTVISDNSITWPTSGPYGCIQENPQYAAFVSTDKNWIIDNKVFGPGFEFYKDPNSGSVVRRMSNSSASGLSDVSVNYTERDGSGNGAAYRVYSQEGTANNPILVSSLQDYSRVGNYRFTWSSATSYAIGDIVIYASQRYFALAASTNVTPGTDSTKWIVASPLYNVSNNGTAGTGVISTGSRTTSGVDDCMETSVLYGDGFLALSDTTYSDTAANVLPSTVALIRWSNSLGVWRQSVSVSGGVRVWSNFAVASGVTSVNGLTGALTIAGTANQISVAAASTTITLSLPTLVTIAGTALTQSLTVTAGYIGSSEGFYSNNSGASAATTVNIPSGGGSFGLGVAVGQAIYLAPWATTTGLNLPGGGYSAFAYAGKTIGSGATFRYYNQNTSLWGTVDFSAVTGVTSISGTANEIIASASTGLVTLSLPQPIATTSSPTFGGLTLNGPITVANGGGLNITFQNTNNNFSVDAAGDITCVGVIHTTGGVNVTGLTNANSVQSSGGFQSSLAGTTNTFSNASGNFAVNGNGLLSCGGVITTAGGLNVTTTTALNSIQSTGGIQVVSEAAVLSGTSIGGQLALQMFTGAGNKRSQILFYNGATNVWNVGTDLSQNGTLDFYINNSTFGTCFYIAASAQYLQSAAPHLFTAYMAFNGNSAPSSAAGQSRIYMSSSTGLLMVSQNGGAFVPLVNSYTGGVGISISSGTITNTGVTSVAGTANEVIVSGSGALTLSLPQAIATTSSPTFSAMVLTSTAPTNALSVAGGVQAVAMALSSSAFNALTTTNGGHLSASGYWVGPVASSTQVINLSGQWVGGAVISSAGVRGTAFSVVIAGNSGSPFTGAIGPYTLTFPLHAFTISGVSYNTIEFAGGLMVGVGGS